MKDGSEVEEDEGWRKRSISAFLLVPNRYSIFMQHGAAPVHPVRTSTQTERMSLLIEILSTALHRPLIGSLGGGEVGLQWSSADWAADDSRCLSPSEYLNIMTLLCTVAKFGLKGS